MCSVINWFEIPVMDMERAKKFYETIFEFEIGIEEMGEATMGFFPCDCDCDDDEECDCDCDSVGGALIKHPQAKPSADGTTVYFDGGEDLQNILDKVEAAGGKIIVPKMLIDEEIGYFAYVLDTEGNKIAVHSLN
jgi:uncharacterized protein